MLPCRLWLSLWLSWLLRPWLLRHWFFRSRLIRPWLRRHCLFRRRLPRCNFFRSRRCWRCLFRHRLFSLYWFRRLRKKPLKLRLLLRVLQRPHLRIQHRQLYRGISVNQAQKQSLLLGQRHRRSRPARSVHIVESGRIIADNGRCTVRIQPLLAPHSFSADRTLDRNQPRSALLATTSESANAGDPREAEPLPTCAGACPSRQSPGTAKPAKKIPAKATPHTKTPTATGRPGATSQTGNIQRQPEPDRAVPRSSSPSRIRRSIPAGASASRRPRQHLLHRFLGILHP